jgi:hypothetical protein
MTLIDEIFDDEMERVRSMQPTRDAYWRGYAAGIMRARFGSVAVSDTSHAEWHQVDALDEQARGYRDGCSKLIRLVGGSSQACQTDLRSIGFRDSP